MGARLTGQWDELRRRLEGFAEFNAAAAHEAIGARLLTSAQLRFRDEAGPGGEKWKPSKRAIAQGGKTLTDTARLRRSLTMRASAEQVEVGSNAIYAGIHNFGGKTGRGHKVVLPARPFLGISDDDEQDIREIVNDALEEAGR